MKNFKNPIYHIFNKGSRNKIIFKDDEDYYKFLDCFKKFNTTLTVKQKRLKTKMKSKLKEKPLVKMHSFTLIKNHFHLILEGLKEGNISLFMQKVCVAYSMYFNKKYKTKGVLFQNRYGKREVESYYDYVGLYGYVAGNSVVHGLVKDVSDYNFCNLSINNEEYKNFCDYELIRSLGYFGDNLIEEVNRMATRTRQYRLEEMFGSKY